MTRIITPGEGPSIMQQVGSTRDHSERLEGYYKKLHEAVVGMDTVVAELKDSSAQLSFRMETIESTLKVVSDSMLQLQQTQVTLLHQNHGQNHPQYTSTSPSARMAAYVPGPSSLALLTNAGFHSPYKRSPPTTPLTSPSKRQVYMPAGLIDADLLKLQQALNASLLSHPTSHSGSGERYEIQQIHQLNDS